MPAVEGGPISPATRYNSSVPDTRMSSIAVFRATLDLHATGVALMRQNLRRERPHASDDDIDALLRRWLHERPGADAGDCPGRTRELSNPAR